MKEYLKNYNKFKKLYGNENKKFIELKYESLNSKNSLHNLQQLKIWYKEQIKINKSTIKLIPLNKCKNWEVSNKEIYNKNRYFFKIKGVRSLNTSKREVGSKGWDQPIMIEPNNKGGILGLLRKKIKDIPHYLVQAKFEPGNYKLVQLSPTLQATFSNIKMKHGGKKPLFIEHFNMKKNKKNIIFAQWFSEEGGRLYKKRNFGMIVNTNKEIKLPKNFKWMTMYQIKKLIFLNAIVNPHLRSLISFI
jgi:oxidase EvaA